MTKSLRGRSHALKKLKGGMQLSQLQKEVLIGLLLGDGHIEKNGKHHRLIYAQGDSHADYLHAVAQLFRPLSIAPPHTVTRKSGLLLRFSTLSLPLLDPYRDLFYSGRKKRVPKQICDLLTSRGLAYWYMDDGSMKSKWSKGVIFNTQGFSKGDCAALSTCLQGKFQLQSALRPQADKRGGICHQIYISGRSYSRATELIFPHLLESMCYKWPRKRARGISPRHTNGAGP